MKRVVLLTIIGILTSIILPAGGCRSLDAKSERSGKTYMCTICTLKYEDNSWAEQCQKWCSTHNSCSVEIAKHSTGSALNQ